MRSAAAYLDTLLDHERSGMAEPPSLDRMRSLLRAIGDPQTWFRSIHVTGTNGKGTVSAATAGLLADQGLAVGTYASPHVDRLTERVALQGHPVQDADLGFALDVIRDAASSAGLVPTWFEVVTAAAFRLFAEHKIDVAVVEVSTPGAGTPPT
jgi:dihydrofolate synthase/folylpolyglutamate synthase